MNQSTYQDQRHERSVNEWTASEFMKAVGNDQVLAVVLTLRQGRKLKDGTWERHTRDESEKLSGVIVKRLNRAVLKNAYGRHRKRLPILCTYEGETTGKHRHLNFAVAVPKGRQPEEIQGEFERCLDGLSWLEGRLYTIKEAPTPENWASYITKESGSVMFDVSHF